MRTSELRHRVERLLNGQFIVDDLIRLFLFLRDRSFGNNLVREIGDFVAHADERQKGVVTDDLRDFFAWLRFKLPNLNKKIGLQDLPPRFPEIACANVKRLDSNALKKDSGLTPNIAQRMMRSIMKKFVPIPTGGYTLTSPLTNNEAALLRVAISYIVAKPVFQDNALITQMRSVLTKNGLLNQDEHCKFCLLKPSIVLFAITAMHQCTILLDSPPPADLMAERTADGTLGVLAMAACVTDEVPAAYIAVPIFSTTLAAQDWCEQSLLDGQWKWEFPIELSPDRKLRRLG
jgi:hypothetical protein